MIKEKDKVEFRHSVTGTTTGRIFEIDEVRGSGVFLVKPAGDKSKGGFMAFQDELRRV
jgi:hypothetical protein